jgi:DNA polymerase-3 subunit epsilon
MYLKLKNPLAFFDLETTGTNISNDRIVELCFLKVFPNGSIEEFNSKINPQVPIPAETSMIHGIYDEDIKDAPVFKMIAKKLAKFLEGCDLAGFNIIRFDVPMLVEEFLRADVEFEVSNRKLVDAQKIFHLMEKRTLSAAYKFYCSKELDGAHSAVADTKATFEVLDAMVKLYDGSDATDSLGKPMGKVLNDMGVLHKLFNTRMIDLAGRMVFNQEGVEVFNFGKHKDKPVLDVLDKEPNYYDWIMKGDFPLDTKRKLTQLKLSKLKF